MELTPPFIHVLQQFAPVFTAPTFQTFLESSRDGFFLTVIVM